MNARGLVAVTVLGAWAAGLAAFARREMSRPATERLAELAMRVSPGVSWFIAERDGRHVGFASITVDTVPRELQVTEYLVTESDSGLRHLEQTTIRLSRGLLLRGFEALRAVGADTVRAEGTVRDDSILAFRGALRGDPRADSVTIGEPVFLPTLAPTILALRERPRPGRLATVNVFDPALGKRVALSMRVAAESLFMVTDSAVSSDGQGRWLAVHRETVRAWRLVSHTTDLPMDVWVDDLGQLVSARRPDGLVLRRTAFELAFENWRMARPAVGIAARANGGIVSGTLLASGGSLEREPVTSLRLRLRTPLPRATVSRFLPSLRSGRTWLLSRATERQMTPRYTLPGTDRWRQAFAAELRHSSRIESDDPRIMGLAARLRGGESDPSRVARAIMQWLRDSIVPDPTLAEASALETLARRRGDANEFARLMVALARASGVPARTVAGLLWADGRFHYHAWAEVYLGTWVGIDPLLGQFPVDAAHVPMLVDGLDARAELSRLLGRLDLEVVPGPGSGETR